MALLKRRIELSLHPSQALTTRPSLHGLNLQVLDLLICLSVASAMTLYANWTITSTRPWAPFTLPFLAITVSRVAWLAYFNKKGEDFSKTLLSDMFCLLAALLFLFSLALALYG